MSRNLRKKQGVRREPSIMSSGAEISGQPRTEQDHGIWSKYVTRNTIVGKKSMEFEIRP